MPKRLAITGPTRWSNLANKTRVGIVDGKRVSLKLWETWMATASPDESADEHEDEELFLVNPTSSTAPGSTSTRTGSTHGT